MVEERRDGIGVEWEWVLWPPALPRVRVSLAAQAWPRDEVRSELLWIGGLLLMYGIVYLAIGLLLWWLT